jgi:predicted methyltransferase
MKTVLRSVYLLLVAAALAVTAGYAQNAADNAADADWFIRSLEVRPGSVVGEIGAGSGELTIAMAKAVGQTGKIFTNEVDKDRVGIIERAVEKAALKNVAVVEGRPAETNFPAQCCDGIFMRNVYHHFGDPPAMNASLHASLKPGGRLAIIDFTPPPGSEAAPGRRAEDNQHGVTAPTLEAELKSAGFEIVSATTTNRAVHVVARRPTS